MLGGGTKGRGVAKSLAYSLFDEEALDMGRARWRCAVSDVSPGVSYAPYAPGAIPHPAFT